MNQDLNDTLVLNTLKKLDSLKQSSILLLALGSIGLLALFCYVDYMTIMPQFIRWAVWLILITVTFWRCHAYVRSHKLNLGIRDAAKDIHHRSNDTKLLVLTAAETIESSRSNSDIGVQLEQSLQYQAQEVVSKTPIQHTRTLTYGVLAFACVVILISFCSLTGMTSMKRILAPWADISYTQIELNKPQQVEVGEALSVSGNVKGRSVESAKASLDDGKELAVTLNESGGFQIEFPEGLSGKQELTVSAGDGKETMVLEPFVAPTGCEIESYEIGIQPPAYASRLARIETEPSFNVLRASRLDYQIYLNRPADEVMIIPINTGGQALEAMRLEPTDGDFTRFQTFVDIGNENFHYLIKMVAKNGVVTESEEPHVIVSRQDRPPKLRIGQTNAKKITDTQGKFEFKVHANDDVAIAYLGYTYHKLGEPDELKRLDVLKSKPWSFVSSATLDLSKLDLEPLDVIVICAVAKDGNDLDGPGIGKSEPFLLEIPEPPLEEEAAPSKGGSGGSPPEVVNPYEIQKNILKDTIRIVGQDKEAYSKMAKDQIDNRENTASFGNALQQEGPVDPRILKYLEDAQTEMELSSEDLDNLDKEAAIIHEEASLANLVEARKLLELTPGGC